MHRMSFGLADTSETVWRYVISWPRMLSLTGLRTPSNLEVMIDLIFMFLDQERENWTWWKHRYSRMEKNFAKNLYNATIAVRYNINWHNKGAKPPIDRKSFYKLMLWWRFEPFHRHLRERRKRTAQRRINVINFYYETFNQEGQEEMRHQIDRDDRLPNVHYTV